MRHEKKEAVTSSTKQKIFGKNAVLECLDSGISINKIWIADNPNPRLKEIEDKASKKRIPVLKLGRRELDRIAGSDEHRSVIAEIAPIKLHEEDFLFAQSIKRILIPVNIEDPHNLGALIRSAYAFDVDALVITKHKSTPVNETVISSSAGSALKLPIVRITNVVNILEKLKKNGFWIYGTVVSSDRSQSSNLYETDFDEKSVIVVGNEGSGLTDNILKHCDFKVYIPTKFESLNVSVATGIILSRAFTQRKNGI